MTTLAAPTSASTRPLGPLGRLGRWSARRRRLVFIAWAVVIVALGALAPRAEHALSGGGWQADGSESVRARQLIERHFAGHGSSALAVVVSARGHVAGEPAFERAVAHGVQALRRDPAVSAVEPPRHGESISADGRVAVVRGGAGADPEEMVRAAARVEARLRASAPAGAELALTGSPALWSQFNEENKAAMMRSELMSWPLTLAVLVVAFGSLAAAGIPLLLSIAGLVATAGALWLGTRVMGITIWAMNFALMFALAVGIDYALFVVVRFRAALRAGPAARRRRRDDGQRRPGRAGERPGGPGLAVGGDAGSEPAVPHQRARDPARSGLRARGLADAAAGGPGAARLAHRSLRAAVGGSGAPSQRDVRALGTPDLAPPGGGRPAGGRGAVALALPALGLHTAMPATGVLPGDAGARVGAERLQRPSGPGRRRSCSSWRRGGRRRARAATRHVPGVAAVSPPRRTGDLALMRVQPATEAAGGVVERLRDRLPGGVLVGGAAAEAHDLERALAGRTPLVLGLVATVGFLLLLLVVRAPVAAAMAVAMNLLATAAAFGVARLIFQDGAGEALLGFEAQGFVDAWAPLFFFCLSFALAMDYSVFLLATAREQLERTGDARDGVVEGMARSGRVINAAGAVMVVVFFTFALSGPLPPKEMGVILGVAVLLDTLLVRLLLLPAALRLLGPRAWWSPAVLRRLPALRLRHA